MISSGDSLKKTKKECPVLEMTAFLFTAMVGMIFGYFLALKTTRLDPIVTLRHE